MINGGTSTAPSAPSGIHATVYEILFPTFLLPVYMSLVLMILVVLLLL
ncbi:hypothetical protein CICLE_v10027390mg [Citrus x clementina]|uniref:Transporter n=1 Tax=Citrus clementina TaxID=85681 RepID=V4SUQ5_CITCL|nr:hypothetical protein CICLE_v10027390mg [Citrus x clementina]